MKYKRINGIRRSDKKSVLCGSVNCLYFTYHIGISPSSLTAKHIIGVTLAVYHLYPIFTYVL